MPLRRKEPTAQTQILLTRIFIVVIGAYVLFWGLFYVPGQDVWEYLGVTGGVYFTGALVVLTCGLYWRRASSTGAVLALVGGSGMLLGLKSIQKALDIEIAAAHVGLFTLGLTFFLMVLGSLFYPDRHQKQQQEGA